MSIVGVSAHLLLHRLLEFHCELLLHLLVSLFFLCLTLFGIMVEDISNFTENVFYRGLIFLDKFDAVHGFTIIFL